VFSVQQARVVNRVNTVVVGGKILQIEPTRWRGTLAGCSVTVCEHLDQTWSIRYGPHVVGRYNREGWPWLCEHKTDRRGKAVEKPLRGKVSKQTLPLRLEIPQKERDSRFPTAAAPIFQPQTGHIVCSKKRTRAYPIDSTSRMGWGRARCARSILDLCTSLESSSVTRPPVGAHNNRLIKHVAPPRKAAMAAFETLLGLGSHQRPTTYKQLFRMELSG
jgi:hypothetical protein